jgi:hypothetical protein
MLTNIKDIVARARGSMIEDALGVTSLFLLLFLGLALSGAA